MELLVYARGSLIDRMPDADRPALLLEGSWPAATPRGLRRSLDEAIDGRFDWIDRQAADWAEQLAAGEEPVDGNGRLPRGVSATYLNALALRYYLVKLIRLSTYLADVRPLRPGDRVALIAAAGRDEDYAELISQHCRAAAIPYRVRWVKKEQEDAPGNGAPYNAPWRRWAAHWCGCLRQGDERTGPRRRVVLCGNPRLLDPVCRELLARRCAVWWLYDRFAVRSWLRWQAAGVGQLVCNSSLGATNRLTAEVPDRLECRGLNLTGPLRRWLTGRMATHGPGQTRLVEQIDAHFGRLKPEAIVLDEDATPMARAAVAVGRHHAVRSLTVQHGVPGCRFGFAPPAADRILVWGESSRQRLVDWGVPPERIRITGSLQGDLLREKLGDTAARAIRGGRQPRSPRILLLATVPPRDGRPDAVALHLTRDTYTEMLRTAFAAVAKIAGAELIVKLHPRSPHDPVARAQAANFPSLRCRVVCRRPLEAWLSEIDCVLSCGSTAGVEATLAGVPVIQLAPPGASDTLPHEPWGLAGTARCQWDLDRLLAQVLAEAQRPTSIPKANVFANSNRPAAARIAEAVLAPDVDSKKILVDIRRPKPLAAA